MQKVELKNKDKKVFIKKEDENILVVKRDVLFATGCFSGLKKVSFDLYQELIEKNQEFLLRSKMELDTDYKQIIPYLVFNYEDKYFLMQRRDNASEVRLQNKFSLGIGGHIRQEDIDNKNIFNWAKREFAEEIEYDGDFIIEVVGLLNDEKDDVGKVHIGFVFLLKGNSNKIKIRSELKQGNLLTLNECKKHYQQMEGWTKIVFDYLNNI